jgi:hypothetical protein
MHRITLDNTVERRLPWNKHVRKVQTHLSQSAGEDEVETTPAVDEHFGEVDFCNDRIQDQGELIRLRKACPLIIV